VEKSSSENDESANVAAGDKKRYLLPVTALLSLSLVTLAAYTQILPGPPIDANAPPPFFSTIPFGVLFSGSCDPYTPSLIIRDLSSTMLSIAGAVVFVKAITTPAKQGNLDPRDARKIIHTLSAPLFVLLWPLFSNAYGARIFASIVPVLNAMRLIVAGTGSSSSSSSGSSDEQFASSMGGSESELAGAISRSGDAKEALGGPFIYVVVLFFAILFFWTDTPIGIVSIATMAVGDGLADLVGRRFGSSNKWFFNKDKSMAGSAAFVIGSFVGAFALIQWLISTGAMDPLDLSTVGLVGRLLAISVLCAGVELIPAGDDNWTVPLSAAGLSAFLLN
jgi:phytol kinase